MPRHILSDTTLAVPVSGPTIMTFNVILEIDSLLKVSSTHGTQKPVTIGMDMDRLVQVVVHFELYVTDNTSICLHLNGSWPV